MATIVDARGKMCPQPVLDTKKAIQTHGTPIIVLVDNEIACQNIEKMAKQMGLCAEVSRIADDYRIVVQSVSSDVLSAVMQDEEKSGQQRMECLSASAQENVVVVLASDCMGTGEDSLGRVLMKGFVYALTQLETVPNTILLYNSGAKLSVQGADTLADLQVLAAHGAKVLTCGTCLNHYGLTEQLAVGEVTNMYVIAETLAQAGKVIRP